MEREYSLSNYRELIAWQKAYQLGLQVIRLARLLPQEERFELGSQLRRNGVSVPSNIAEGYGRRTLPDYIHFLTISRGALYELDTQLLFCVDLGYIDAEKYAATKNQLDEAERVLAGLIRALELKLDQSR